ncbi:FtsK/SpoIIIE domain-containing protein [Arthrobacter sp. NEB 688]|uniref:FtsK/SpoIIIE domain-containing protein n=1 Tax=Arthrobacter sp. NEB 688 TaxID=904039 RepID=UPI001C20A88C|nr:FtsK/SpoIIIE domain-containing protein [Arthrobacter sp. NEB 688]
MTLVVRARAGQTLDQLEAGVPGLAATLDALSWRCSALGGSTSTLLVELVMHDALREPRDGTVPLGPTSNNPGHLLPLGRRDVGGTWGLTVAGRHTLVAGCSGAGKGSVLWGLVAGLAALVPSDTVRLWGIDLKHGVELRMGRALFAAVADTGPEALAVLTALLDVAEQRGQAMAGQVRAHTPRPGDPLHVLVIDELADLVAYADRETRMEAARLLARLLTKGRALGVVVAAFVQDPRKDVVTMRNLFTQRVALRLLSDQETAMVLGDGAARTAPAHRISPTAPGSAWVVDDEGNSDRVRADYWPDPVIRDLAARYPCRAPVLPTSPEPTREAAADEMSGEDGPRLHSVPTDEPTHRPRRPRSPRAPRAGAVAGATSVKRREA